MTTGDFSNLSEQDEQGITIYPNPVKDKLYVQSDNKSSMLVELYDLQGKMIYSLERYPIGEVQIDMSRLDKGIYLAVITAGELIISEIVTKQ